MRRIVGVILCGAMVTGCSAPGPKPTSTLEIEPSLPPPVVAAPIPPAIPPPSAVQEAPTRSLTLIQGTRVAAALQVILQSKAIEATVPALSEKEILMRLGLLYPSVEGAFLPDTYRFADGTSDLDFLKEASNRMEEVLQRAWENRDPKLPLKNKYELLILASIVEKETALDREAPLIAGVFIERINRRMKLQSDPTVIYGMGAKFAGRMQREDLRRDTPYNTYTRDGLPPTPICLPSRNSIEAVARPTITGALFFVLTGKPDGSHHFSKTYAEHQQAVQRYLKSLRK